MKKYSLTDVIIIYGVFLELDSEEVLSILSSNPRYIRKDVGSSFSVFATYAIIFICVTGIMKTLKEYQWGELS